MQHASALLELLLPALLTATPTRAPEPSMRPSTSPRTVELEIVEKPDGGKRSRTRLELPVDGKLEAWVGSDAHRRVCKVESHYDRDRNQTSIHLDCHEIGSPEELELSARPTLALGKRVTLAKIDRPDGGTTEVSATWR